MYSPRLALALALLAGSAAQAAPGDVLWSISRDGYGLSYRPAVGQDGALYWTFRGLYRLDPATGNVMWFRENQAGPVVSISSDGTIYGTGAINLGTPEDPFWQASAIALTPDNQLIWERMYDLDFGFPEAGPTLGPDGNLYYIAYAGYRTPGHLFSLTTGGDFRWERRFFAGGTGAEHLTFAGGSVMKVDDYVAVPGGPISTYGAGLVAADMQSGQLTWAMSMAPKGDPVVSPVTGRYYVTPGLSGTVRSVTAPTNVNWVWEAPWSPTGVNTQAIGPDGNLYVLEGLTKVHSLNELGQERWHNPNALPGTSYFLPTVSPDGSMIMYPSTGYGDTPGFLTALSTTDGHKLWEITFPGPTPEGYGPVRCFGGIQFSPDGRVAYVPASSICYTCGPNNYAERSFLYAMDVGGQSCYANCDASTAAPVLNIQDFSCFLNRFASGDPYANCDGSSIAPVLNVADFSCFLNRFAGGCP